jgi:LPS-assembly protein
VTPLKAHALHAQKGKFFRVHLLKQPAFKALIALWKTSLKRWIFSVLLIFLWFGIDHESRSDDVSSEPQKIHSSRMVLKSPSVTYHENSERMTAQGGASLYYKGRILKADTLTFDRLYKRFEAQGNVHLIETNGTSLWADQLQMTEDFSSGFVDGLNLETSDKTYFSSPRAERTGDILTFDKARYSACAPCKMGQRAPFWQLKATRIVHNKAEKMIYYENPQFEIFGIPILYAPYLSTADPTVRRKTGFLTPYYSQAPHLGFGVSLPFFINLAPHYDLTFTPSILTKQGVLGQLEWRQRLEHGQYMIRLSGISQQNTKVFLKLEGNRGYG